MLLKFRKLLIIILIVAGLGYIGYIIFMNPNGFTDKEDLVNSYFNNITNESVCSEHFNPETKDFCTSFQLLIEDKEIEVISLTKDGDNYLALVKLDDEDMVFEVSFEEVEVTGLKSFLNKTYYLIDIIT